MTDPNRLPLRVLVKGPSTPVYTSWMSGPRSDFTWPRVIESELYAAGFPAEVQNRALPAEPTYMAFRTWQDQVLAWSPDVVILAYGEMECVHLFLPRFLERHVNAVWSRPTRLRTLYRTRVLRPVWKVLAQTQARLDARLPPTTLSYRLRRVERELEKVIGLIRTVASPLVLIPDLSPPGETYRRWFPGMAARNELTNEMLRKLVERLDDPDIRFTPMNGVLMPLVGEGEDLRPDGGHLTPELHRAQGEALADVIIEWAEKQPHLDLSEARARRAAQADPPAASAD